MKDPLSPKERSERMAKVRGTGNKSTEQCAEAILIESNILNWEKHPRDVLGKPDFYFRRYRLALFVDGCFWHACPVCKRHTPAARQEFWRNKIEETRKRDNRQRRHMRAQGYHVIRVWEHEVKKGLWIGRLRAMMRRIERQSPSSHATE